MSQKKYVSLSKLSTFLNKLKEIFASKEEVDNKTQVQIITWEDDD